MKLNINLNQELTDKLFSILEARKNGQTAEELAAELLEDSICVAYIRDVDGYRL